MSDLLENSQGGTSRRRSAIEEILAMVEGVTDENSKNSDDSQKGQCNDTGVRGNETSTTSSS